MPTFAQCCGTVLYYTLAFLGLGLAQGALPSTEDAIWAARHGSVTYDFQGNKVYKIKNCNSWNTQCFDIMVAKCTSHGIRNWERISDTSAWFICNKKIHTDETHLSKYDNETPEIFLNK